MNAEELTKSYLADSKIMQLATSANDKPWVCTVHFVADEDNNIYWLSLPTRRHSIELAANPRAAIAIAVKTDMPVIGVQAEGDTETVTDLNVIKKVMELYIERHSTGKTFVDRVIEGTDNHKLYRLIPKRFSLFDEVNFPKTSPQVWEP